MAKHRLRIAVIAGICLAGITAVQAETVYQSPEEFVAETFAGQPPESESLWITGELRDTAQAILGHKPPRLRERYWRNGSRTAWILEEIGKHEPITVGLTVEDDRLVETKVLVYRESRGWEVRLPAFTRQFENARLTPDDGLDRRIDGISGATLSVRAMRKLALLALTYHAHVLSDAAP